MELYELKREDETKKASDPLIVDDPTLALVQAIKELSSEIRKLRTAS